MEKLVRVIKLRPGEAVLSLWRMALHPVPVVVCAAWELPLILMTNISPMAFFSAWMTLHRREAMCYVTIFDGSGKPITVEVSREIYQVFADYEREMERQRKEEYRHRDARSWDTCLIFELSTEPLEQTYERMRTLREIQEALLSFTPKQRRRFLLHFAYGYTYLEIARMEGSNKSTVMRSAKTALKKIQEKLAA